MMMKRYLENILDHFDGKEQEVVECSIHMGWIVPNYLGVAADVKLIRDQLPKLTQRFISEANANRAIADAIYETPLLCGVKC